MVDAPPATEVRAEPVQDWLEPIDFARLFTVPERIAMRGSADPVVQDFLWMLDRTRRVWLDHPDTVAGLAYMVGAGLLTEERAEQVKRGEPPPAVEPPQ